MLSRVNTIANNKGTNMKLVIRHSIRPSLKGVDFSNSINIGLTEEGIEMAFTFGNGLSIPLGFVSSSESIRCVQTIEAILDGANTNYSKIETSRILTSPAIKNQKEAMKTLCNTNLKQVAYLLSINQQVIGFTNIRTTSEMILDYIFESGNEENSLDIYCTHDFNIVILLLFFWPSINTYKLITENWPEPLEGVIICGNRNEFEVYWRNYFFHYTNH